MHGAIPPLPHTPSWRGSQLKKHRDKFTFLLCTLCITNKNQIFIFYIHGIWTSDQLIKHWLCGYIHHVVSETASLCQQLFLNPLKSTYFRTSTGKEVISWVQLGRQSFIFWRSRGCFNFTHPTGSICCLIRIFPISLELIQPLLEPSETILSLSLTSFFSWTAHFIQTSHHFFQTSFLFSPSHPLKICFSVLLPLPVTWQIMWSSSTDVWTCTISIGKDQSVISLLWRWRQ